MPQLSPNAQVLVVGATGGIGGGFVRQWLADDRIGCVFATYRDRDRAADLFALQAVAGDRLVCLPCDPTIEANIVATIERISEQTDRLHAIVHCVGMLHEATTHTPPVSPEKSLRHINRDQLLRYFEVNSIPTVLLAKHLQCLLKHRDPSVFATISAKVGSIGDNQLGGWYGYRASKAALNMLVRNIAIELRRSRPEAIVVALHPGTTDTGLSQPFQGNVPAEKLFSIDRTVSQLLNVIEGLTIEDSGEFFSWDGSRLPW
jgi:NAD(P)-dependent dehydrogenase (short-subunit alcohol dehydrogenase family)